MCNKVIFESERAAKEARRWVPTSRKLRAYYCKECGGYHIGSMSRHTKMSKTKWKRKRGER